MACIPHSPVLLLFRVKSLQIQLDERDAIVRLLSRNRPSSTSHADRHVVTSPSSAVAALSSLSRTSSIASLFSSSTASPAPSSPLPTSVAAEIMLTAAAAADQTSANSKPADAKAEVMSCILSKRPSSAAAATQQPPAKNTLKNVSLTPQLHHRDVTQKLVCHSKSSESS